jgi:hypothetical protein
VVSGSYPRHWAVIVGHTPKKYHVRLDNGQVTVLNQESVKLSDKQSNIPKTREPKVETYRALVELELAKIESAVESIRILLDKIKIEEGQQ